MKKDSLFPIRIQSLVMSAIREYLDAAEFQEVVTPVLSRGLPLEPTLYGFQTTWDHDTIHDTLYLATSPENGLKKLMALGIGNCYTIGKTFRNMEGTSTRHRPEFLMLEWYRKHATYKDIMRDTVALIRHIKTRVDQKLKRANSSILQFQGKHFDLNKEWNILSIEELCRQHLGVSIEHLQQDETMLRIASEKGYDSEGATWEQLFNQFFLNELEKEIPDEPCFLVDFPSRISPLCTPQKEKPFLAERFELFINRMEIGNGNTENTNSASVRTVFEEELQHRALVGKEKTTIDQDFLKALDQLSASSVAGIGLGIERLVMLMADINDIQDINPLHVR